MNAASVYAALQVSQNGLSVSGSPSLSGDGQDLLFTPSASFAPGALIQVFISSTAMDALGYPIYPSISSFTVAPDLTGVLPAVIATSPGQNDAPPLNTIVQVQFSKPLNPSTVNSTALILTLANGTAIPGRVTLVGDRTIQLAPSSVLAPSAEYYIQVPVTVKDSTGLSLTSAFATSFITSASSDAANPRVLYVTPPDTSNGIGGNAPVHLQFSENINPLTANASTIQLAINGTPLTPASFSYGISQDVTITPFAAFPDNTKVAVSVSGVQDEAGNAVIPFTSSFITGASPIFSGSVISISPAAQATRCPFERHYHR